MEKITYDEIINRIGYFRTKANLSLRETSARLGYNPQFMKTIENKSIELTFATSLILVYTTFSILVKTTIKTTKTY